MLTRNGPFHHRALAHAVPSAWIASSSVFLVDSALGSSVTSSERLPGSRLPPWCYSYRTLPKYWVCDDMFVSVIFWGSISPHPSAGERDRSSTKAGAISALACHGVPRAWHGTWHAGSTRSVPVACVSEISRVFRSPGRLGATPCCLFALFLLPEATLLLQVFSGSLPQGHAPSLLKKGIQG